MEQDLYIGLIYKRLKGEINHLENKQLDDWLQQSDINIRLYKEIELQWNLSENYSPEIDIDVKADLQKLKERIKKADRAKDKTQNKIFKLNPALWIAASLLILISAGLWLFSLKSNQNVISTASNEKKHISLPDGSEIWLNENSRVKYPDKFASDKREISMEGEVFFSVEKDKNRPFIIDAIQTKIEVLGTSFNVKTNQVTKETKVDVKTGKVRFSAPKDNQKIIIVKGETAIYNDENHFIKKTKYDINSFAWQSSILLFKNESLTETIKTIEKYYKVNISVDEKRISNCIFSGRFEDKKIDEVLQYLSDIFGFKIHKLSISNYKLSGGSCQ